MRFLAALGTALRAAIVAVSRMILHIGHLAGFGPHPDDLVMPPVEPSPSEAEADRRRAEYEALIDDLVAQMKGLSETERPQLPERISGWAHSLAHEDVIALVVAHRDGRLEGHLDGTRPIFGVPPVANAADTATYVQRRSLLHAAHQTDAAARRLHHDRYDRGTVAPGNRFGEPDLTAEDAYARNTPRAIH